MEDRVKLSYIAVPWFIDVIEGNLTQYISDNVDPCQLLK